MPPPENVRNQRKNNFLKPKPQSPSNKTMKKFLSIITAVLLFSQVSAKHHKSDELKSIFNGKNLDGWSQKNGTATYAVDKGAIIGKTNEGSPNSFLCSDKLYGDLPFFLQFRQMADLKD